MHREYHPDDMEHLRAHALGEIHSHDHHEHQHDHRGLFLLTVVIGVLIGLDVALSWSGLSAYRRPWGISLIWVAALLGAARIVSSAIAALTEGRLGADFALAQACLAALVLREPFVAAEVVFIALVGEVLEAITADRAMRAIGRLFEATPRTARVRRDEREREVPIGEVRTGDVLLVASGERIAADGTVLTGRTAVDEALLTGEPHPVDKGPGEEVHAGTINQFGAIEVRVDRVGTATTIGQVMRYVADAQRKKSRLQRAADRYARWFLPVVEGAALATVLAGYLLGWPDVWQRAVAILVVACPCALVLATPAAIMASLAWLARHGVVAKGGAAIERLAECDTLAFDKTGTLTEGRPELATVLPLGSLDEPDLLRLAATAEAASRHPIALAVRQAAHLRGLDEGSAEELKTLPGAGVEGACRLEAEGTSRLVIVGNHRLMVERGVVIDERVEAEIQALNARGETTLLVASDGVVAGLIGVRDRVRPEAHDVVHDLKHLRFREIALLTGDGDGAARFVAKRTHIPVVESGLRPEEKAGWIRRQQEGGRRVVMVGDGINDAPALATAHVGIALGRLGSDLAAEAGDMVLLGEPLRTLPELVRLSRKTVGILRQNILGFAFGLNGVAIAAAALGWLPPVPAAILHQAGSLLVLLNSMRLLAFGGWRDLPLMRRLRTLGGWVRAMDDRLDPGALLSAGAKHAGALVRLGLLGLSVFYLASGWTAIGPDEVGLVRRNGRFAARLGPGLHWRLPVPWERVTRIQPEVVRSVEVGFRESSVTDDPAWSSLGGAVRVRGEDEGLMMTGDGQMVETAAVLQYRLGRHPADPWRFVFGVADAEPAVRSVAESVLRGVIAERRLEDLLGGDRRAAELDATSRLQRRLAEYGLGLDVVAVVFTELHPPLPVVEAYRDVNAAESDRLRRTNEGESVVAERVTTARGEATAIRVAAEAEREGRRLRASGESAAFLDRLAAHSAAPRLGRWRLYWDTVRDALAGRPKVILDPSSTNRRHLILPDPMADREPLPPALPAVTEPAPDPEVRP